METGLKKYGMISLNVTLKPIFFRSLPSINYWTLQCVGESVTVRYKSTVVIVAGAADAIRKCKFM